MLPRPSSPLKHLQSTRADDINVSFLTFLRSRCQELQAVDGMFRLHSQQQNPRFLEPANRNNTLPTPYQQRSAFKCGNCCFFSAVLHVRHRCEEHGALGDCLGRLMTLLFTHYLKLLFILTPVKAFSSSDTTDRVCSRWMH